MLDDISKLAACNACVIASALRVCLDCKFNSAWNGLDELVALVPPEPEAITDDLEFIDDWAMHPTDDPRTDEQRAMDEWQAEVDDLRAMLLGC